MEKEKLDKILQEIEPLMDSDDMDKLEGLYMLIVAKLAGKSAENDLWPRYQQLWDHGSQPETTVVGMVGAEYGFPGLWDLLGGMVEYMSANRGEPVPAPVDTGKSGPRELDHIAWVALSTALRDRAADTWRTFDTVSQRDVAIVENKAANRVELLSGASCYPITMDNLESFSIKEREVVLTLNGNSSRRQFRLVFLYPVEIEGNMEGLEGGVEYLNAK